MLPSSTSKYEYMHSMHEIVFRCVRVKLASTNTSIDRSIIGMDKNEMLYVHAVDPDLSKGGGALNLKKRKEWRICNFCISSVGGKFNLGAVQHGRGRGTIKRSVLQMSDCLVGLAQPLHQLLVWH